MYSCNPTLEVVVKNTYQKPILTINVRSASATTTEHIQVAVSNYYMSAGASSL
jgi:hypothetical protein